MYDCMLGTWGASAASERDEKNSANNNNNMRLQCAYNANIDTKTHYCHSAMAQQAHRNMQLAVATQIVVLNNMFLVCFTCCFAYIFGVGTLLSCARDRWGSMLLHMFFKHELKGGLCRT